MARDLGYPLPVLLLLMFAVFAIDCEYITTKNEPQFLDNSMNQFEEFNGNSESAAEEINEPKIFKQKSNHDIIKTQIDNNKSVGDLLNKTHSDNCCCSCKEILNVILQQQSQILNILQNGLSTSGKEKIKFDLLPPMPFKDINDFLDFDESLVNENVQDQFGAKLKKLLGSTEQKSVTNMMSSVMTNELCKNISWIGIKDTIAFGNTNMVTLIVVSSSNEQQQQQQQQPEVAVSEVSAAQSNGSAVPSAVGPTSKVSSSEEDSLEEDADEEEDDGGGEEVEEEEEDEGKEDEAEEDEGSKVVDDDEYEDELRAVASKAAVPKPSIGEGGVQLAKEVSKLLEYKRLKKSPTPANIKGTKDKRVPTVKKELSTQKEIALADNETQVASRIEAVDHASEERKNSIRNELQEPDNYEKGTYSEQPPQTELSFENAYTVLRAGDGPKKLSKRQGDLLENLKAYLLNKYVAKRDKLQELGSKEVLLAESLLNLLAKLPENPQRWERMNQLLTNIIYDLNYTLQVLEARKRFVQGDNPFTYEASMSMLTTSMPESSSSEKSRRKLKKKKKKKKKQRHQKFAATTITPLPTALTTTEAISTTMESPPAINWRLVAERLFGPHWIQKDLRDDEPNINKVRYTKPQLISISQPPLPIIDKESSKLKMLNSEREALMLKAAREYTQPRRVHFGKVNTHQQTSAEDLDDRYDPGNRSYQRTHIGQLANSPDSRIGDNFSNLQKQQQAFDLNFARNQEYLPPGREFAASKPWQAEPGSYGYPWSKPKVAGWNSWREPFPDTSPPKPWLPWHTEREYYARLEEEEDDATKAWKQAQQRQQQQNWNRPNLRDNLPPWLEDKDVQRVLQSSESWPKPEKSPDYGMHREQNLATWENTRHNHSELKENDQSKSDADTKETPKLTMKTWSSLTSDPATWPFKPPGVKPWPKDEHGNSYNPNAELVRKLGLYQNGRVRPDKEVLKDLKQQKLQKNDKSSLSSKVNSWVEPDESQSNWYNENHWNNNNAASPSNSGRMWSREKITDDWNLSKAPVTSSSAWPKWKQFAYHKVTAQPTSKTGVTLDKSNNKNAFIAVSAVSAPKYNAEQWRKNDIEEIGQVGSGESITEDSEHPASQRQMNIWKKSREINRTTDADNAGRTDVLENQLENLKENDDEPVLLEINVSIKNSTSHQTTTISPSAEAATPAANVNFIKGKIKKDITSKEKVI